MEKENSLPAKGRQLRVFSLITLGLLTLSFLWLFYDLYAYMEIRERSQEVGRLGNLLGAGYIVRVLLFVISGILLLKAFRRGLKTDMIVIAVIATGVVAAITTVFDFAALSDIGQEYLELGYECVMEWTTLFLSLIIRILFLFTLLLLIVRIMRSLATLEAPAGKGVDEVLFEITQYIGIICGMAGVMFTIWAFGTLQDFEIKAWHRWLFWFYCAAIIIPYFTVLIYWVARLAKRKILSLYDEKQKQDIAQSGLATWLISIPVMILVSVVNFGNNDSVTVILWFPFYLFSTLLIFSVMLLVKFIKG
jgi:hypothetical protein